MVRYADHPEVIGVQVDDEPATDVIDKTPHPSGEMLVIGPSAVRILVEDH